MTSSGAVRFLGVLAVLVVAGLIAPSPAHADGNANFFLGQKMLDDDLWDAFDAEDQAEFGVEVSFGKKNWPVQIAIDLLASAEKHDNFMGSGIDVEGKTSELAVGVRKIWEKGKVRPYLGGGLASVTGEIEGSMGGVSGSIDDTTIGGWVGGGVFWRLGSRFNIGFSLRYSKAEVTFDDPAGDIDVEAGGTHVGLLLGWGWPATK